MTEKKGKRAVIISNIKSNSIEQAIFILKTPEYEPMPAVSSGIVAEAQEIINSYISTIERGGQITRRRKTGLPKKIIAALSAAICVVWAALAALWIKL